MTAPPNCALASFVIKIPLDIRNKMLYNDLNTVTGRSNRAEADRKLPADERCVLIAAKYIPEYCSEKKQLVFLVGGSGVPR